MAELCPHAHLQSVRACTLRRDPPFPMLVVICQDCGDVVASSNGKVCVASGRVQVTP